MSKHHSVIDMPPINVMASGESSDPCEGDIHVLPSVQLDAPLAGSVLGVDLLTCRPSQAPTNTRSSFLPIMSGKIFPLSSGS